jgi:hypothetical protein
LAKQTQSNYGDNIAELNFSRAHAMNGNCPERGKCSALEVHFCRRDSGDQHAWHTSEFRMDGEICSSTSDAVSNLQMTNSFADFYDRAGTAVSQSDRLIEAATYGGNG